ncbi:hypothetical protein B0A55_09992 [Friedmanniomyces simplex]|uniref:SET domain-containing protein n=1 Tax=Friedmanniomyces simplex TaxID=329884 RepID=A0A4U0WT24_9PEZI|nr:hypothetical protein B0A55_09992 [Friedmanniomyces simplex]
MDTETTVNTFVTLLYAVEPIAQGEEILHCYHGNPWTATKQQRANALKAYCDLNDDDDDDQDTRTRGPHAWGRHSPTTLFRPVSSRERSQFVQQALG